MTASGNGMLPVSGTPRISIMERDGGVVIVTITKIPAVSRGYRCPTRICIRVKSSISMTSGLLPSIIHNECERWPLQPARRGGIPMETIIRFHTLMVTIAHVNSTVSFSLKWARTSS